MNPQPHIKKQTLQLALTLGTILLVSALAFAQPQSATSTPPAPPFPPPGTVTLTATVTDDRGLYISELSKETFTVLEGKQPREITFFRADDRRMSVAIVFDISESMSKERVAAGRAAIARFIQHLGDAHAYMITAFDSVSLLLADWTHEATSINAGLNQIVEVKAQQRKEGQATAIYDACTDALKRVASSPHPKHVLVLFSGGRDIRSRIEAETVWRMLKESNVLLYAIGFTDASELRSDFAFGNSLHKLAVISGGDAFFPKTFTELDEVAERVVVELGQQYVVGFAPANGKSAGKWNEVKLKVASPLKLKQPVHVRSRGGYFSPSNKP